MSVAPTTERQRIREAAERLRAGERAAVVDVGPPVRNAPIKQGEPCKDVTPLWKQLHKAGYSFAKVKLSGRVSPAVKAERDSICETCLHCTHKYNGKHSCECCPCPDWRVADTESKNKYRANVCPAGKFGEYIEESTP